MHLDFNTKSFLNYHDYKSDKALIEKIIELDNDDNLYRKMLAEPWYNSNQLPEFLKETSILNQFDLIIKSIGQIRPVSQTVRKHMYFFIDTQTKLCLKLNTLVPIKKTFR